MLSKDMKIPRKMFPLFLRGAETFKNNLFLLKTVSSEGRSRFCFSVSKKVAKNAVLRNKLRRAGYRLLKKYVSDIRPDTLALFSFRVMPQDSSQIARNLESIIRESRLTK